MKVDAYEILIYHTDISYLPLSEMGHIGNATLKLEKFSP